MLYITTLKIYTESKLSVKRCETVWWFDPLIEVYFTLPRVKVTTDFYLHWHFLHRCKKIL